MRSLATVRSHPCIARRPHVRRRSPGQAHHPVHHVFRPVHGHARQHGRQRGPAHHPARLRLGGVRPAVDHLGLHAVLRQPHADRRHARRPLRPQALVPDRARGLLERLAALRTRAVAALAGRGSRHPGRGRGRPAAGHPLDPHHHVPRPQGARPGDRPMGRRLGPRLGGRARCSAACWSTRWAGRACSSSTCRSASSPFSWPCARAGVVEPRGPLARPARPGPGDRLAGRSGLRA